MITVCVITTGETFFKIYFGETDSERVNVPLYQDTRVTEFALQALSDNTLHHWIAQNNPPLFVSSNILLVSSCLSRNRRSLVVFPAFTAQDLNACTQSNSP